MPLCMPTIYTSKLIALIYKNVLILFYFLRCTLDSLK